MTERMFGPVDSAQARAILAKANSGRLGPRRFAAGGLIGAPQPPQRRKRSMSDISVRIHTDDGQSIDLDSSVDSYRTLSDPPSAEYPRVLAELDRLRNDLARMWKLEER